MKTRTEKTGKRQPGWWKEPGLLEKCFGCGTPVGTGAKTFGLSFARLYDKIDIFCVCVCVFFLMGTSEIDVNTSKLIIISSAALKKADIRCDQA